jgi:parallel beta-helix repeat protein
MQQQELRRKLDSFKIPLNNLIFGDVVGKGGFGSVFEGICNGKVCAIKEIRYENATNADAIYQDFLNESYLMVTMYHYNIVDFMGWSAGEGCVYVIMELAPFTLAKILKTSVPEYKFPQLVEISDSKNSVEEKLERSKMPILTNMLKLQVATDVANGMHYLHTRDPPVIHADLKSPNILLDERLTSKICDFGIAKVFKKNNNYGTEDDIDIGIAGTEGWMAPEVYTGNILDARKIDVYSFGMVLYELITHQVPYANAKDSQHVMSMTMNGERPIIPNEQEIRNSDKIMNELIDLFYRCTELDPDLRPTFHDLTKILFFPIPGRIELIVDQNAEPNIQTFNTIQDAIDNVLDEVLHAPAPRAQSINKVPKGNSDSQKQNLGRARKLPTMLNENYKTIIPATRSLRPPLVHVMAGEYCENLYITRTVELRAEGIVTVIPKNASEPVVIMDHCGGSTFRKFTFPRGVINVTGIDSLTNFKDCTFEDTAIKISDASNPFVTRCKFINTIVHLSDQETRSTFFNNDILGEISVTAGATITLQGCKIHDSKTNGVNIGPGCKSYILDCDIFKNKRSGIYIGSSSDPLIENNRIHKNGKAGIEADEEAIGLLRKNEIKENQEQDIIIADSATTWNEDVFTAALGVPYESD